VWKTHPVRFALCAFALGGLLSAGAATWIYYDNLGSWKSELELARSALQRSRQSIDNIRGIASRLEVANSTATDAVERIRQIESGLKKLFAELSITKQ